MTKQLIVVLQLIGLVIMINGGVSSPTSYGSMIIGGLIALTGGLEFRRREREESD